MSDSSQSVRRLHLGPEFPDGLHRLILEAKNGDALSRVTVVTPSYFSSFFLRRALASRGLINVEFMRIEDLAEFLAEPAILKAGTKSLTRIRAAELVHTAAMEAPASGPFAAIVEQPSFHTALHRTLSELEAERSDGSELFSPEDLAKLGSVPEGVAEVWKRYERAKRDANLHDRTGVAHEARIAIDNGALLSEEARIQYGAVMPLLIATPAAQYRELWRKLATAPGIQVVVGITGDQKSDTAFLDGARIELPSDGHADQLSEPAEMVAASDVRSEVAALTRRIIADSESNSVPFNKVAVLYSDRSYAPRIEDSLGFAGIPVSGPDTYPVSATAAGRFLIGILEIVESSFSRDKVGHWLSSTPVKDPVTAKLAPGSRWDGVSKSAGITGGAEQWNSRLSSYAKSQTGRARRIESMGSDDDGQRLRESTLKAQAEYAESLQRFMSELSHDLRLGFEVSWKDFADWATRQIEKYLDAYGSSVNESDIEKVNGTLGRISELDSISSVHPTFQRFAKTVKDELGRTSVGLRSLGRGVFVAHLRDAAGCQFDRVHIVGMSDGSFPSSDSPDPLLPDELRHRLNTSNQAELPLAGMRANVKRREFYAALRSAPKAVLYWPKSSGASSREAGPSQWLVDEARRWPENERIQAGQFLSEPDKVAGLSGAGFAGLLAAADTSEYDFESVTAHVHRARTGQPVPQHFLQSDRESGISTALELELGRSQKSWSKWSGDVSGSASSRLTLGMATGTTSASRIQTYATCPLQYFFAYVLDVEPTEKPEETIYMPADRRGSFVHTALENYLNLRIEGQSADESTLDRAMDAAKRDWRRDEPLANRTVWEVETEELRRKLSRWLAAEKELITAGFEPVGAEVRFGMGDEPPLEITLEDGSSLRFSGVIDRVDKGPGGAYYVFDYKTGKAGSYKGLATDPVDGGKRLQLALYSLAVVDSYEDAGAPHAAYWFVLDGPQMAPDPLEFDHALASKRLLEVISTVKTGVEAGMFPPNPGKSAYPSFEACKFCDFERVCPSSIRKRQMLEAHTKDLRLSSYFNLSGEGDGA